MAIADIEVGPIGNTVQGRLVQRMGVVCFEVMMQGQWRAVSLMDPERSRGTRIVFNPEARFVTTTQGWVSINYKRLWQRVDYRMERGATIVSLHGERLLKMSCGLNASPHWYAFFVVLSILPASACKQRPLGGDGVGAKARAWLLRLVDLMEPDPL